VPVLSPCSNFPIGLLMEQDLSKIEPTINGPFTPDLATPLSKFASFIQENGWEDRISAGLIGSCTNSSYEDMVSPSWKRAL
jgi:homoaconitase